MKPTLPSADRRGSAAVARPSLTVLPSCMGELRVLVEFRGYQPRGKRLALTAPVVAEGLADTGAVYTYVTRALAARIGAVDLESPAMSVTGSGERVYHPLVMATLRIGNCDARPTVLAVHDEVAKSGGGVLLGHLTMQERRAVLDYRDHSLTCPEPGHPPSDLAAAFDRMASPRAPRAKQSPRSAPARPRRAAKAPTKPPGRGR